MPTETEQLIVVLEAQLESYAQAPQRNVLRVIVTLSRFTRWATATELADQAELSYKQAFAALASAQREGWVRVQQPGKEMVWMLHPAVAQLAQNQLLAMGETLRTEAERLERCASNAFDLASSLARTTTINPRRPGAEMGGHDE